ncbi:hypothetical protein F0562_024434 [Nyssa sinensis]|uniref:CCHC-type domain-containing protein n=1 Tax=Nyssa sinensis TaxID=561372 RepID=A0A5J5BDA7_9ASTE|nr:hypothetical protein F0562_024434 [Nyssa sinensis]
MLLPVTAIKAKGVQVLKPPEFDPRTLSGLEWDLSKFSLGKTELVPQNNIMYRNTEGNLVSRFYNYNDQRQHTPSEVGDDDIVTDTDNLDLDLLDRDIDFMDHEYSYHQGGWYHEYEDSSDEELIYDSESDESDAEYTGLIMNDYESRPCIVNNPGFVMNPGPTVESSSSSKILEIQAPLTNKLGVNLKNLNRTEALAQLQADAKILNQKLRTKTLVEPKTGRIHGLSIKNKFSGIKPRKTLDLSETVNMGKQPLLSKEQQTFSSEKPLSFAKEKKITDFFQKQSKQSFWEKANQTDSTICKTEKPQADMMERILFPYTMEIELEPTELEELSQQHIAGKVIKPTEYLCFDNIGNIVVRSREQVITEDWFDKLFNFDDSKTVSVEDLLNPINFQEQPKIFEIKPSEETEDSSDDEVDKWVNSQIRLTDNRCETISVSGSIKSKDFMDTNRKPQRAAPLLPKLEPVWPSVIDKWKTLVVREYTNKGFDHTALQCLAHIETFLGESAKTIWEGYKLKFPDDLARTVSFGANPWNFVNKIQFVLIGEDPNLGIQSQQQEAMAELERLSLSSYMYIKQFLVDFMYNTSISGNAFNPVILDKLMLKLPGALGKKIQERWKIALGDRTGDVLDSIGNRVRFIVKVLKEHCTDIEINRQLKGDNSFCRTIYTPQQYGYKPPQSRRPKGRHRPIPHRQLRPQNFQKKWLSNSRPKGRKRFLRKSENRAPFLRKDSHVRKHRPNRIYKNKLSCFACNQDGHFSKNCPFRQNLDNKEALLVNCTNENLIAIDDDVSETESIYSIISFTDHGYRRALKTSRR